MGGARTWPQRLRRELHKPNADKRISKTLMDNEKRPIAKVPVSQDLHNEQLKLL
jgi:hypothetical protein